MTIIQLPIIRPITVAFRDLWQVLFAMRTLAGTAVLIILAVNVLEYLVPLRVWAGPFLGGVLGFIVGAVQSFIILGEAAPSYVLDPHQRSFQAFFGWLLALSAMSSLVTLVHELFTGVGLSFLISVIPFLLGLIAVIIVTTRLTILFPAIAVDARGANASNAWADTAGNGLNIFIIFLLVSLPFAATAIMVAFTLAPSLHAVDTSVAIIGLAVGAVTQTLVLILYVAIASRIFRALADRVLRAG